MNSMTALAGAPTSPPTVGGGGLVVLVVVILAAAARKKTTSTDTPGPKGSVRNLIHAIGGLVGAVRFVVRFYSGRELRGGPRSTATFFRAGTPTTPMQKAPAVSMASIAVAPPKVSLVKTPRRQPSPWARKAATWLTTYSGRGAQALDRAVRAALWTARTAGRIWRVLRAVWRFLRAVYAAVAPVVATIARTLRGWHCWPYAARGLTRLALTAVLVGLAVPAWRGFTLVVLVLALAVVLVAAYRFRPKPPGDDVVYGPKIWTILRADLNLPEDEPWEHWLSLPARLAADDARIVVRLPWTFRGSQMDKDNVTALINSRLPGEWVGRFTFTGEHATAVYTHKPPPKPPAPKPAPPKSVDIEEPRVQEALAALAPDEFLLGADEHNELVIRRMAGEVSHWAYSVGSGGGKSTTLQWLAVQMLMKRGTILGVDPKLISLAPLEGIPGVFLYKDPENGLDMRRAIYWVADVVMARFYEIEQGTATEFDPLYVFLEESNELAGILRNVWNKVRVKKGDDKDPAADPIWEEAVGRILRFGRAANVHLLAVFQDFKDNEFSGQSLRPLFPFKVLGSYDPHQWERITGMPKSVMPPPVKKPGLMVTVADGVPFSYQTPYLFIDDENEEGEKEKRPASEDEAKELYNKLYRELRERHGWSDRGLYSEPPAVSPRGVPKLLQGRVEGLSRDTDAHGPIGASEGGLSDETAGHGVTHQGSVTPGVTGQRDRLRLIPGQAGAEGPEDPLAAPTLLTIAEIAREMQSRGYDIEAGLIRQHKRRRETTGFPVGIEIDGAEKFTLAQLITFYEQRGLERRVENQEDTEQDDAV
ncbi:hypothetical protein HZZ00_37200 (plasmid) [Streptomyces sp. NEAU-sy36]|uniref:hypothetical protein n=1 Tax=unclassified Streptomyces TaxID=2593676 RepID=UPI0015D60867|nr:MULTISPECIES: hypothetical protein [unclassified Streptomyces]QLJ06671.1 hypothetical protein HZZ00_37200 [Streptomyces sp. NEAU-sy36]